MADKLTEQFEAVAKQLVPLFTAHRAHLEITRESEKGIYCAVPGRQGPDSFFGAVDIVKNYVSFHLMPVYIYPELMRDMDPRLKKRMQGKSCFNFKKINNAELTALENLVVSSVKKYKETGYLTA